MPPKKAQQPSKKAEAKAKTKVIEDKTFGMKNKKGNKAQKYIVQVEKQVKGGGNPDYRKQQAELEAAKKRKEEEKKAQEEIKSLFKPIQTQRVDSGVDPKSIFCAFFKQGLCKKGDRCKFSHDPECERKAAKRNIYEDTKDDADGDNMDEWDDAKLAEVVSKKHGAEKGNSTDIICKYFLDALDNNKYGWFWSCPNGGTCMYKHALPKGYVLKKDQKRQEKERQEISIEDLIEKERAALSTGNLTKVTLQTFVAWKKKKLKEKEAAEKKTKDKKKSDMKSGKTVGMSGRDMFQMNPSMVGGNSAEEDDEEGADFDLNIREKEEDDGVRVHEIKFDAYGIMDDGLDDSTDVQLARAAGEAAPGAVGGAAAAAVESAVIDEDLFDDEDLDDLEDDLENLDI